VRSRSKRRGVLVAGGLGVALVVLACFENPTSPAKCPEFCPGGGVITIESLFTDAIERDSSFQGYVAASQSPMLLATDLPGIDSRPIFQTANIQTRFAIDTGTDTTTGPIVVDSMKLTLTLLRHDTVPHNLRLAVYQLPLGLDSTTSFAALGPAFAGTALRVVNVDSLVASPTLADSVAGDTVLAIDTLRHAITLRLKFPGAQALYSEADTGKLALGVRVSSDIATSVALLSIRGGVGPSVSWFYGVDSAGTILRPDSLARPAVDSLVAPVTFDGFVYTAPTVALDSNLTVGGLPSTRALLRFVLPKSIRDSSQIIRATLLLVADNPPPVVTPDSVFIRVRRVFADLGAKSPAAGDTIDGFSAPFAGVPPDTVAIEVTNLFRLWQADTISPTVAFLELAALDRDTTTTLVSIPDSTGRIYSPEGSTFSALRFFSSRTPARRPALRLTYVPRIRFGAP
jgi:hypothetical protein